MQKTRQQILEFLKLHSEATVAELCQALDNLTPVTVRHHLDIMRGEGLVEIPEVRHRTSPGRPQYAYRLTEKAEQLFPNNLPHLTRHLISEIKNRLSHEQATLIFENIADNMANEWPHPRPGESMSERLDRTVTILNQQGYMATWYKSSDGYLVRLGNCPYGNIVSNHSEVCEVDTRYLGKLLGMTPKQITHRLLNDMDCTYLITE